MFWRRKNDEENDAQMSAHVSPQQLWCEAVAPQALELGEDHLIFPAGVLVPLTFRERAGTPGDPRREIRRVSIHDLLKGLPSFYTVTFKREAPDTMRGALRARRTLFEATLMALAEKTGRRPSMAEQATDQAMDLAESVLASGEPIYKMSVLLGLFHPDMRASEQARRELESRLRAAGVLPQRFYYIPEQALTTMQPGGHLFHGVEEHLVLFDEVRGFFPTPHRRVMPAQDSLRLGRHAYTGQDVFFSFSAGFDPEAQPPTHSTTLILGDMGSGKTTLLRLMLLQRLFQGRTVVSIDPEGENNRLCQILGGTVIEMTPPQGDTCLFHPLVAETPEDLLLATRFLATTVAGEAMGAMATSALHEAVRLHWERRAGERMSVEELCELLEIVSARVPDAPLISAALRPYARGGLLDGFFDREKALIQLPLPEASWINFDLSGLRDENRHIVHAMLAWFFYHVITRGRHPVDIFIDEGWRLLRGGVFADLLDELGRRARKRGVGVVLVTHLPGDLVREGKTSLSLAAMALVGRMEPDDAFAFYRSMGVSEAEATERAEITAQLPKGTFLAAPSGGRGSLFPVKVEVPPSWITFFEATSPFKH